MLFMYIHTRSPERCTIDKPAETARQSAELQASLKKAGAKMVNAYAALHEHTMFLALEANDLAALERALTSMTLWGEAELVPAVSAEQWAASAK